MRTAPWCSIAGLILVTLVSVGTARALDVVEGRESAVYEILDPAGLLDTPDLHMGGFSQRVLRWEGDRRWLSVDVRLERHADPGASLDPPPPESVLGRILPRAAPEALTELSACRRIIAWIGAHVAYRTPGEGPESAGEALRDGRASCQGRTALALSLAAELGVTGRPIHGILVEEAGSLFHRWPAFRLGPERWIMADPGGSLDFVDARYIVGSVTRSISPGWARRPDELGIAIRRVDLASDVVAVDRRPGDEGLRARGDGQGRTRAGLVVRLVGQETWEGWALALEGAGRRMRTALPNHEGRAGFVGLSGGTYLLTVLRLQPTGGYRRLARRVVELSSEGLERLDVRATPGGAG